ncbi:hypothetical protein M422DRAFT_242902 [Sphaerobolus stellatus SS14]|nr:hypothetical protein M422DRAFT_242902 [Sphaerobolus stellatus SS14]
MFIGGDGNFHLHRHHKGGGVLSDPSLFGDEAFYAPQNEFKEFYKIHGLTPDEAADIWCANFRAGNPNQGGSKHATNRQMSISCSAAEHLLQKAQWIFRKGKVTQVLADILEQGINHIVISYDVACNNGDSSEEWIWYGLCRNGCMEDQGKWHSEGEVAVAVAMKKRKGWQPLPWIWKMQLDADIDENEEDGITQVIEGWTTEGGVVLTYHFLFGSNWFGYSTLAIQIEWVQATASLTRFEEELKLLEVESERVARTFKYYEKKWKDRAAERFGPTLVAKGAVAYAHRCTKTFQWLARLAEMDYTALLIHKKMRII